uniref:Uncharacterized protein n=1 Tax=Brassica oleracea var. oleracea TaxID=109376 RepID=A0A0D3D9J3_BRAOL
MSDINNDINVLESSHLFSSLAQDERHLDAPIEVGGEVSLPEVDIEEHDDICFQEFLA